MTVNNEHEDLSRFKRATKAKQIMMIIVFITGLLFLGLLIYILVAYGIDATGHADWETTIAPIAVYAGIPLFSISLLSGIAIGITNLIIGTMDEEETTKEFKLVEEVEQ
jgi:hypothetical protein